MLRQHVDHLPARHAARPGGEAESLDQLATRLRVAVRVRLGENLEGAGLQGVAREDRRRLVERFVRARPATAQVVVVHGGKVIVDERVGVQHFHARRDPRGARRRDAEQRGDLKDEEPAQPLAAAERGIAHGLDQLALAPLGDGQERVQGLLDEVRRVRHGLRESARCLHQGYSTGFRPSEPSPRSTMA